MTIAPQSEFDFEAAEKERALMEHWARLERIHREEWTEENKCIAWVTGSDGRAWRDWWTMQPSYDRSRWLAEYRCERETADFANRGMLSYAEMLRKFPPPSKEGIAQNWEIINTMAEEIRQAAMERRPMPRRESEEMSPLERMAFQNRLQMAIMVAGCVVIESQRPPP